MWYHVSEPNSYLVLTGAGINSVRIRKKAFVKPSQKVCKISITPFDFSMALQAMTSEKLKFSLPAVFTIGPEDNFDALIKYAVLLTGNSDGTVQADKGTVAKGRNHVQDVVKGIIEGETRSIVSTMTMEELFNKRGVFKSKVIENVQSELNQFGLKIYNANVKELQDMPGSQYFQFLSQKAHEGAQNQAKVDVANARMIGETGEAERQGETKQKIAKINAHTAVLETERKIEKSAADSKLKSREIEIERGLQLERIEAARAAEQRDAELQKTVEQKKAQMELERLRATTVTKAKIDRESAREKTDAAVYTQTRQAEAAKYAAAAEAESRYKTKEMEYLARERQAEAEFVCRKREAEGLLELSKAYGALSNVLGGPQGLMGYFALEKGLYESLANANAKAVHGLQPKINVWNTGNSDGADATAPIRNLFQTLPPLFSTIQDQTGISPPQSLAQMPGASAPDMTIGHGSKGKAIAKVDSVNGFNGANGVNAHE